MNCFYYVVRHRVYYPLVVLGTYTYHIGLAKTLRKIHDNYVNLQAKPVAPIQRTLSISLPQHFHGVEGPPGDVLT